MWWFRDQQQVRYEWYTETFLPVIIPLMDWAVDRALAGFSAISRPQLMTPSPTVTSGKTLPTKQGYMMLFKVMWDYPSVSRRLLFAHLSVSFSAFAVTIRRGLPSETPFSGTCR